MKSSKIVYEKNPVKSNSIAIVKESKSNQSSTAYFSPDPTAGSPPNKFISKLHLRIAAFHSTHEFINSNNLINV